MGRISQNELNDAVNTQLNKTSDIGDKTQLQTTNKTDLVSATNEVVATLTGHLADYIYQTPTIVGTQIQITKQSDTTRLYFKLDADLTGGAITISLDGGTSNLPLKDIDGNALTELSKGYVEVVDNTTFFTLRPRGASLKGVTKNTFTIENGVTIQKDYPVSLSPTGTLVNLLKNNIFASGDSTVIESYVAYALKIAKIDATHFLLITSDNANTKCWATIITLTASGYTVGIKYQILSQFTNDMSVIVMLTPSKAIFAYRDSNLYVASLDVNVSTGVVSLDVNHILYASNTSPSGITRVSNTKAIVGYDSSAIAIEITSGSIVHGTALASGYTVNSSFMGRVDDTHCFWVLRNSTIMTLSLILTVDASNNLAKSSGFTIVSGQNSLLAMANLSDSKKVVFNNNTATMTGTAGTVIDIDGSYVMAKGTFATIDADTVLYSGVPNLDNSENVYLFQDSSSPAIFTSVYAVGTKIYIGTAKMPFAPTNILNASYSYYILGNLLIFAYKDPSTSYPRLIIVNLIGNACGVALQSGIGGDTININQF